VYAAISSPALPDDFRTRWLAIDLIGLSYREAVAQVLGVRESANYHDDAHRGASESLVCALSGQTSRSWCESSEFMIGRLASCSFPRGEPRELGREDSDTTTRPTHL